MRANNGHQIHGVEVTDLAEAYGTPLYVYDGAELRHRYQRLRDRLPPELEIFYSLKANPNVSICALLGSLGARAEVSSLVELITAGRAGIAPRDTIFLGPGKSEDELAAALDAGIYAIVCESYGELAHIDRLAAARGRRADVALRVNPEFTVARSGLTMGGKPRQFGIDAAQLFDDPGLARRYPHVRLMGVHAYLGTRILDAATVVDNVTRVLDLAERLAGRLDISLELVDVGGGLGVAYFEGEADLDEERTAAGVTAAVAGFARHHPETRLALELGRYLTATSGTYVVLVRYVKTSLGERFAITDGGTNHHMAASGTGSFVQRNFPIRLLGRESDEPRERWQVCGPLCTPNDTIGKAVALPPLRPGDLIGVSRSGAYGPTASPGLFLSHGYPAEVLVDHGRPFLVRDRDEPADLLRAQHRYDPVANDPVAHRGR
jgi:diaminopimelate decarboxylase